MFNPYANVDFSRVIYVPSVNHLHCTNKTRFEAIYDAGVRHFALSNYQPSHPTYPLVGNEYFNITAEEIPEDIIPCPNSEKVNFADASMHITCPGSLAATYGHNWPSDVPKMPWKDKFNLILSQLLYDDGGGIIINHPVRSSNKPDFIIEKLNYDFRVLGVEVYNHRSQRDYGGKGYYFDQWDEILSQGYRCFGFCTPDEHSPSPDYVKGYDVRQSNYYLGRNVLLLSEYTEHDALKAYREGRFYGAYYGDRIKFTRIEYTGNKVYFETDMAQKIDIISYSLYGKEIVKEPVKSVLSNNAEFTVDKKTIFVRAIAHENAATDVYNQPITDEKLFTQAIMFKSRLDIQFERASYNKYAKYKGEWKYGKLYVQEKDGFREIPAVKQL